MRKAAILGLILTFGPSLMVKASSTDSNLIAWWKFDDGAGSTARDSSGGAHDGAIAGPEWTTGRIGGALRFSGKGNVSIPDADRLFSLIGKEITVTLWQYGDSAVQPHDNSVFQAKRGGDRESEAVLNCHIPFGDANVNWAAGSQSNSLYDRICKKAEPNEYEGRWNHWALTKNGDSGQMKIYLNGVLWHAGRGKAMTMEGIERFAIGSYATKTPSSSASARCYYGLIDDFRIYNLALKSHEIYAIYRSAFPECTIEEPGAAAGEISGWAEKFKQAANMLVEQKYEAVAAFLEEELSKYTRARLHNQIANVDDHRVVMLAGLYFQLARIKKVSRVSQAHVTTMCRELMRSSNIRCFPYEASAATIWLLENDREKEHTAIVNSFVERGGIEKVPSFPVMLSEECESSNKWDILKKFLDILEERAPAAWIECFEYGLEQGDVWRQRHLEYSRNKPQLTKYFFDAQSELAKDYVTRAKFESAAEIYCDLGKQCGSIEEKLKYELKEQEVAEECANQKRFKEAVEIYQGLAKREGTIRSKAIYELKVCKCLFEEGNGEAALAEVNKFMGRNKIVSRSLMSEAILMKGQCHIRGAEIEKGLREFLTLMAEYPESKQAAAASFFMGYCYMMQGKYPEAKEALNVVTRAYPESSYANKAASYLSRLESITK
ncbi:MAG TPA: LamG-like jellyroll fold domain-containing protein [Sedimentisphaerales bacterium]|nr:LamG-like jellyroll fold domain-containing protein [Sedimentisphaerales bacterium]